MYCGKCGNKLEEKASFCAKCGNKAETLVKNENSELHELKEAKIEATELRKRRNRWMGWVMIAFSSLGLLGLFFIYSEGGSTDTSFSNSPMPYLFDLFLGYKLIRQQEKYLNWIFWRVVLGFIFWSFLSISQGDIATLIAQALYSVYFVYMLKFDLTERSFKIANYVLLPVIILSLLFVS